MTHKEPLLSGLYEKSKFIHRDTFNFTNDNKSATVWGLLKNCNLAAAC